MYIDNMDLMINSLNIYLFFVTKMSSIDLLSMKISCCQHPFHLTCAWKHNSNELFEMILFLFQKKIAEKHKNSENASQHWFLLLNISNSTEYKMDINWKACITHLIRYLKYIQKRRIDKIHDFCDYFYQKNCNKIWSIVARFFKDNPFVFIHQKYFC